MATASATATTETALPGHDLQGLLLSGYGHLSESLFLLLRVVRPDDARRWVAGLADRVTSGAGKQERRSVNVAFTVHGLRALGLQPAELRTFSAPFREGMPAPHRARVLGDTGASDPVRWAWGGVADDRGEAPAAGPGPLADAVHVVLLLYACDPGTMRALEADELALLTAGGALEEVHRLTPEPLPGAVRRGEKFGVEHFGFADGMSQPVIEGSDQAAALGGDEARRSIVAAGELVLGRPNAYGDCTPWPRLLGADGDPGFGRNGTYLVARQLAQDVAGFWSFLDDRTRRPDGTRDREAMELLAAKLVGRWPSGAPLVRAHHRDDPDLAADNAFGYAAVDPHGERCPLGAHIRRSNPRDAIGADPVRALVLSNRHRILRRGRVYGPGLDDVLGGDDGRDRGLHFLCLNANIERQFEFVLHTWANNPKFAGLYDEYDPITGTQPDGGGPYTLPASPIRSRVQGLRSFVTVRGGAYFFMPGIAGLRRLGALAR